MELESFDAIQLEYENVKTFVRGSSLYSQGSCSFGKDAYKSTFESLSTAFEAPRVFVSHHSYLERDSRSAEPTARVRSIPVGALGVSADIAFVRAYSQGLTPIDSPFDR